ncbi:MAG TPA: hypothetical protein VNO30_33310 [Kofleriaceae bacterium]|nr:hypothetical protein [Kofleriaceae bacterium]
MLDFGLTISIGGSVPGLVTSEAAGIKCDHETCTHFYQPGTRIQLVASSLAGSFLGWSDACSGFASCELVMDQDHHVAAQFGSCVPELIFQRGGLFQGPKIFRVDLERYEEVPVSNKIDEDVEAAWSPDGNRIALTRNLTSIWVVNRDGSNPIPLASESGNALFYSAWSPDGSKVAYTSTPWRGGGVTTAILVAASDGTGIPTNLTPGQDAQAPLDWSPDGTQILFTSIRTGDYEVFRMFTDGSEPINLSNRSGSDGRDGLRWSPDGSKILYIGLGQVWVANADGSDPKNLTGSSFSHREPIWSHDGKMIYFVRGTSGDGEIWVMNANGAGQRLFIGGSIDVDPQPSPDGTKIAWSSKRDGNYEIYVANIDGSNPVRVTNNSQPDGNPRWRPCP